MLKRVGETLEMFKRVGKTLEMTKKRNGEAYPVEKYLKRKKKGVFCVESVSR